MNSTTLSDPSALKKLAPTLQFESDPDVVLEKISRMLSDGKKLDEMSYIDLRNVAFTAGIGSQLSIADAVNAEHSVLAVTVARQFIEEYQCKTPSEVAVAEVAAASYVHFIVASKRMSRNVGDSMYEKQVTLTHRRFLSSLGALRQMKQPPVAVNLISAQTAFVGQNQVAVTSNKQIP